MKVNKMRTIKKLSVDNIQVLQKHTPEWVSWSVILWYCSTAQYCLASAISLCSKSTIKHAKQKLVGQMYNSIICPLILHSRFQDHFRCQILGFTSAHDLLINFPRNHLFLPTPLSRNPSTSPIFYQQLKSPWSSQSACKEPTQPTNSYRIESIPYELNRPQIYYGEILASLQFLC